MGVQIKSTSTIDFQLTISVLHEEKLGFEVRMGDVDQGIQRFSTEGIEVKSIKVDVVGGTTFLVSSEFFPTTFIYKLQNQRLTYREA